MNAGSSENLNFPSTQDAPDLPALGDPPEDWKGWLSYMAVKLTLYVAKDPWGFLTTVLLCLTPLFLISAYCAYRLASELKKQEAEKKLRAKRSAAIAKGRKQVKAD